MKKNIIIISILVLISLIGLSIYTLKKTSTLSVDTVPTPVTETEDLAIDNELMEIFNNGEKFFQQGDFASAIKEYKKITENSRYQDVDFSEYSAVMLASQNIEEAQCAEKYETIKTQRTPEETVRGLLESIHQNTPQGLDFISCLVTEAILGETNGRFIDRSEVLNVLLGLDSEGATLTKIHPGSKTFVFEKSEEHGDLYRITNETEALDDDVLLHLMARDFSPGRFLVDKVFRSEKTSQ